MTDDTVLTDLKSKFSRLLELREKKDVTKLAADQAKAEYQEEQAKLYRELQEEGIRGSMTFDFGGKLGTARFGRRATHFGRVVNKQAAIDALKAAGQDDAVLQESVAQGRLNELVRECLETGRDLPDGVDYYTNEIITVSRKKGGDALDV